MEKVLICCLLCVCSTSLVQGAPQQNTVLQELIKIIWNLKEMVKMDAEELHSPTNMPVDCFFSAFKCFVNESLILKPAKNQNEDDFNDTLSRIKFSVHNVNLQVPDQVCPPCTNYKKKPVQSFIDDFITLLQKMNIYLMSKNEHYRKPT